MICLVFQSYQEDFQTLLGCCQQVDCLRGRGFGGNKDWKYHQGWNLGGWCFINLGLEGWIFG